MNVNDAANLINIISTLQANSGLKQQLISLINFNPNQQSVSRCTRNIPQCGNQTSRCLQCDSMQPNQINKFIQLNPNNPTISPTQTNINCTYAVKPVIMQKNCVSIEQCPSIKRIIKLHILRNKYSISNHQQINEYISKCKEFNNLNNDYQHSKIYHSTNNQLTLLKQILNKYVSIYDFIANWKQKHVNNMNQHVSFGELDFFNNKMDDIYKGLGNYNCTANKYQQIKISQTQNSPVQLLKNNSNQITSVTGTIKTVNPFPTYYSINSKQNAFSDNKFVCTECGKKYKHECNLKSHMKIHSDEALICSHCNKRFGRKANYKEHLRIHTGETPYQCSYCLRKFKHHH
eukprot:264952_1